MTKVPDITVNGDLKQRLKVLFGRYGIIFAFLAVFIIMSFSNQYFLTTGNLRNVMLQVSVNGLLATGMTFVILNGGIDLSVGSVLAFAGIVAASFVTREAGFPVWVGVGAGVLAGIAVGAINGALIAFLTIPAFVATLGMLSAARGLTRVYNDGMPISSLSSDFVDLGIGRILGIPIPVIMFLSMLTLAGIVLKYSKFGRYVYAVGGNEKSARVSGVRTKWIQFGVYVICGAYAGIAGTVITALNSSAQVQTGVGYELDAIAAVVIGGTSLSGGRGSIIGTLFGVLLIGIINNGLDLVGASSNLQPVIKGAVIVLAVFLDIISRGRRT